MATSALSEVSFTVCCVSCVPLGALNWKHLIIFVGRLSRGLRQRPYFRCSQVRTHLLHSSLTTLLSSTHTLLTLYSRTLAQVQVPSLLGTYGKDLGVDGSGRQGNGSAQRIFYCEIVTVMTPHINSEYHHFLVNIMSCNPLLFRN